MAYDPVTGQWKPEDTSVERRVTGLLSKESPLMKQAATQGAQASNRRGLMNSSMGVQAGQASRVAAALPIASQDAGQAHEKNLQGRSHQMQHTLQREQQGFVGGENALDREHQSGMQQADLQLRETISRLDREAQERIATMNVAASERHYAASMAASFEQSYAAMVSSIMANPDLPPEVRQQYIAHAGRVRDSNLRLVEQMYGIELNWGGGSSGGGSGTGTGVGTPGLGNSGTGSNPGTTQPIADSPQRKGVGSGVGATDPYATHYASILRGGGINTGDVHRANPRPIDAPIGSWPNPPDPRRDGRRYA